MINMLFVLIVAFVALFVVWWELKGLEDYDGGERVQSSEEDASGLPVRAREEA